MRGTGKDESQAPTGGGQRDASRGPDGGHFSPKQAGLGLVGLKEMVPLVPREKGAKESRSFLWHRWVCPTHSSGPCLSSSRHMTSESVLYPWDPTH